MSTFWYIELLGTLCARQGEQEIRRFRTRKAAVLLAYLAYFGQKSHARDSLIELLWPEAPLDDARNNLSVCLHSLRKQLEPPGIASGAILWTDRTHVRLNAGAMRTDVADFEEALRFAGERSGQEAAGLAQAAERYRGELLPGYFEDWVLTERVRLEDAYLRTLRRLTHLMVQAGEREQALEYAHRAVRLDPLREQTRRDLIRLYIASGRPHRALEQYHDLERLLAQKSGGEPSAATRELVAPLQEKFAISVPGGSTPEPPAPAVIPSDAPRKENRTETQRTRGNLPVQFSRFFGRLHECERIRTMLVTAESCLLTLTGPGGIGKTRLALEAAQKVKDAFPGGIWFVSLADLEDAGRLYERVLDVVSRARQPGVPPLQQVIDAFAGSHALLILDNLEQLGEAGAKAVQALREPIPSLSLIATTRQPLEIAGEQEIPLSPLPTPHRTGLPERLLEFPSVQLFVDRAQARQPDFQITRRNAASIAALCDRLEGLPLAIELASGWAKLLTPQQMLAQVENRFAFLVSRRADLPERHRSLRAALESSYRLLRPAQQRFFARLSIFRGGWTMGAVERVCEESGALTLLAELQHASLIMADETDDTDGIMRYRLLETLREFGAEQLAPDERDSLARCHAEYFCDFSREVTSHFDSPKEAIWLSRLDAERENILLALRWFERHPEHARQGIQMAIALKRYWSLRHLPAEGQHYLSTFLRYIEENADETPPADLHKAHTHLGTMHYLQGDFAMARHHYESALALAREHDDRSWEANLYKLLGNVAWDQGDYEAARLLYETGLALFLRLGNRLAAAHLRDSLGLVASSQGDFAQARQHHEEALPVMREGGRSSLATTLLNLGDVTKELGDYEAAVAYLEEGLEIARELEIPQTRLHLLNALAFVALYRHDIRTALPLLQESLSVCANPVSELFFVDVLEAIGSIPFAPPERMLALRLWGYTGAVRRRLGVPRTASDKKHQAQAMAETRLFASEKTIAAQCDEGERQSREQSFTLAQELLQKAWSLPIA